MHVVASAPSPQRASKWHCQALPSLECFLLISVSGNGNAPRAQSLGAAAPEACEEDHVHLHLCFNSASLFHKRGLGALHIFAFEGVSPHVVPNKASGGAYADAARVGVGFQRRLGDVRAAEQYLKEQAMRDLVEEEQAALANSKQRLGDVRAARQYLKEQAMRDLVEEERAALANSVRFL